MGEKDFFQQGGLVDLSPHEEKLFDWLIMEGAEHDYTSSEIIPQFLIEDLDLFLGCSTTDDPAHVAEVAVLFEMHSTYATNNVHDQIERHLLHKPEGVWIDITEDDYTHVWIVLSLTEEELNQPYLDYRMRRFLNFAHVVVTHLDDLYWLD